MRTLEKFIKMLGGDFGFLIHASNNNRCIKLKKECVRPYAVCGLMQSKDSAAVGHFVHNVLLFLFRTKEK